MILPHYTAGKDVLLDLTMINAMHQDLLKQASEEPKYTVGLAYNMKWVKYGEQCA